MCVYTFFSKVTAFYFLLVSPLHPYKDMLCYEFACDLIAFSWEIAWEQKLNAKYVFNYGFPKLLLHNIICINIRELLLLDSDGRNFLKFITVVYKTKFQQLLPQILFCNLIALEAYIYEAFGKYVKS